MNLLRESADPRLLLVEDNRDDARLVRALVEAEGRRRFRVVEAETLAEALEILERETVDLILLDLALPDAEGLETIQRVLARTRTIPIVVLTASDDDDIAAGAIQAGAQDYLLKGSLDAGELTRTLRHAMERHRLLQDLESARAREKHRATHDPLTGLPNRTLFQDRLEHALAAAQRYREQFAVGFIDLDGFKAVNDTLGHAVGDQVLVQVASRLNAVVRKSDTVARMGGDEFTILVERIAARDAAESMLAEFVQAATVPLRIEGQDVPLAMSLGVAVFPDDGHDAEALLRAADAAMYRDKGAKGSDPPSGRPRFRLL